MKDTAIERLMQRVREAPDAIVYEHLADGEQASERRSFRELFERASAIAAELSGRGMAGKRVLLLYPPGLSSAEALFGCWLASAVAVPAPAPPAEQKAGDRIWERISGIARVSGAALALAPASIVARLGGSASSLPSSLPRLATDALAGAAVPPPAILPAALAYLQFTSGSTSEPKGVSITHGNLMQNCMDVQEAYQFNKDSVIVSWVPTHHDLGLVYAILMPVVFGFRSVMMPPEAFVARPIRWLAAMSVRRATHSVSPNFGFDLAVLRTTPEERKGLDLSSLRALLNGAEPIRRASEARFSETFAPFGLSADVISHSYGLAEVTAKVTAERSGRRGIFVSVSAPGLEQGQVRAPGPGERAVEIAGCGAWARGTEIAIVDPEARTESPPDRIGEIWIRSGSVAEGYFGDEAATEEIFRATLASRPDIRWLKTGDLGFLRDGQLFIAGRSKDLILVRGENHYPQDLEHAITGRHPAIRPACAAAFSVDRGEGEKVVIVTDVYPEKVGDSALVFAAVQQAVAEQGLRADVVLLTPPQTVPKTSSGKVQRRATRERWLSGRLPVLYSWEAPAEGTRPPEAPLAGPIADAVRAAPPQDRAALVEAHVCRIVAERLGLSAGEVRPDSLLKSLGVDSIAAVELGEKLSNDLRLSLYAGVIQDHETPREVAAFVVKSRW